MTMSTMRKVLFAFAGAGLAAGLLVAPGAQAGEFSVTVTGGRAVADFEDAYRPRHRPRWEDSGAYERPSYGYERPRYGYDRPRWGHDRPFPGYGRPVFHAPGFHGERCVVRVTRYWDGEALVKERRRVCR